MFMWNLPAGKHEYGWMTLEGMGKDLCALNTLIHPTVLDSGDGRLRNARQFGQLALAQFLKFAQDADGLSHRDLNSFFCRTEPFHFMVSCNRERRHEKPESATRCRQLGKSFAIEDTAGKNDGPSTHQTELHREAHQWLVNRAARKAWPWPSISRNASAPRQGRRRIAVCRYDGVLRFVTCRIMYILHMVCQRPLLFGDAEPVLAAHCRVPRAHARGDRQSGPSLPWLSVKREPVTIADRTIV
jgi:hypothetical protein